MSRDGSEDLSETRPLSPSPTDPTRTSESSAAAPAAAPEPRAPAVGPRVRDLERYQILGEHGRGGLGRVSRAHDRELGRDVAIKELISRGPVSEVRFLREALITARLEHPGIVPVHEAGRWPDGTPFYAMKLVAGRPLRDLLAERPTVDERIGLLHHVIAVADAIAYAHGRRIIHRDLKPSNVIVGDFGETVVIDWGLAKDLAQAGVDESGASGGPIRPTRDDDLTSAGSVLGTPAYMAPEQRRGEPADQRADVFAIGAMLWELCALKRVPPTDARVRRRMLGRAGIDPDLATIIDKALDRDPARRYPDAGALAADLKAFKAGARIAARRYSLPAMLAHWTRRHRALAVSAAAAVAIAVAGGALYIRNVTAERDRADRALARAESAKDAVIEANQATQIAYDGLSLKNAELLLASDPSAAWDVLQAYRGPDRELASLLRAKAWGLGVARVRASAHKDTVTRLQPLADGTLLSFAEDGAIVSTTIEGRSRLLASNATNHNVSAWSPARAMLAYACLPEGICLLDTARHASEALRTPDSGAPESLSFSPDGYRLAARYGDRVVVWDLGQRRPAVVSSSRPPHAARVLYLSSDHVLVASPGRIYLMDVATSTTREAAVFAATAIAGDEDHLLAGDARGDVLELHPNDPSYHVRLGAVCESTVNSIILLRARQLFAYACQDGRIGIRAIHDAARVLFHRHEDSPMVSLASSADARYIAFGGQRGAMYVYDLAADVVTSYRGQITRLRTLSGSTAAFPFFASGDDDGYVRIWDLPSPVPSTVIAVRSPLYDTALLEDGTVIGIGEEATLRWWNAGEAGAIAAHESGGVGIRQAPDLRHFATFGTDGEIILWATNPIREIRRMRSGLITNVAFMKDGQTIVSSGEDGRLVLWRPDDDTPQVLARFARPLTSVQVLRGDETLIVAERGGSVWRIDPSSGAAPVQIRSGLGGTVSHLVASDDGRWLGVGTSDGEVLLYPTTTWKPVSVMKAHGAVHVIVFSLDMAMISVISEDGFAYLVPHPEAAPREFPHWRSVALPARNARFSPDGRFLAITTSNDGVLFYSLLERVWHYFPFPAVDVFRGRFSRDGSRFAIADSTGRITLFDLTRIPRSSRSPQPRAVP